MKTTNLPTTIPHYIWFKSDANNDEHFTACWIRNLPMIVISNNGRGFAYISYDTLSMFGGDSKESEKQFSTVDQVLKMYKGYSTIFSLPDDQFQAAGGETAFGFEVKKEHADFIAEGLYHFLLARKP